MTSPAIPAARVLQILERVYCRFRLPGNITADEMEYVAQFMEYDPTERNWQLNSLGELELDDLLPTKNPTSGE